MKKLTKPDNQIPHKFGFNFSIKAWSFLSAEVFSNWKYMTFAKPRKFSWLDGKCNGYCSIVNTQTHQFLKFFCDKSLLPKVGISKFLQTEESITKKKDRPLPTNFLWKNTDKKLINRFYTPLTENVAERQHILRLMSATSKRILKKLDSSKNVKWQVSLSKCLTEISDWCDIIILLQPSDMLIVFSSIPIQRRRRSVLNLAKVFFGELSENRLSQQSISRLSEYTYLLQIQFYFANLHCCSKPAKPAVNPCLEERLPEAQNETYPRMYNSKNFHT